MTATFAKVVKWLSLFVTVTPCYVVKLSHLASVIQRNGEDVKKGEKIAVILVAQCMALAPEHNMLQNLYEAYE